MSTIPITSLIASDKLRQERSFNSLFAAYATTKRKRCGKCRKKPSLVSCRTLLSSLVINKRTLLIEVFNLPADAKLSVYTQGDSLGVRVE
jgi:hypothetical protein